MGTDFSIRPVGASVVTQAVGPMPDAAKAAVPTELPADKTVGAPARPERPSSDPQADGDRLAHRVVIDRAAAAVVYRVIDNRTSLVVRQFPDEARLRARAYLRAQDAIKLEHAAIRTDRRA